MILRASLGWPIELIAGRPITNIIRRLIHTDIVVTWRKRKEGRPVYTATDVEQSIADWRKRGPL